MSYVSLVSPLAYTLQSMDMIVDEVDTATAVLTGLSFRFESLIVALDILRIKDKLFVQDFMKSRLPQEQQSSEM